MIKPIPQFEVWQSSRYFIFFENLYQQDRAGLINYVNEIFDIKTISNTTTYLLSQDFDCSVSLKMFELKLSIGNALKNYNGAEQSFINDYILVRLQEISNKFNKTIYLKCNVNIPNVYIPKNYIITPEI
jgi:hypothetical protein